MIAKSSWIIFRGLVNSYGIFQTYYSTNLLASSTASAISWIGSIQAFLLLFAGIICGRALDAGYFFPVAAIGGFLEVFGMMMTYISKQYWQVFLSQCICVGLGCGCLFTPSIAIIGTYFSSKRSIATGIAASGSSVGTSDLGLPRVCFTPANLHRWCYLPYHHPADVANHWLSVGSQGNGLCNACHYCISISPSAPTFTASQIWTLDHMDCSQGARVRIFRTWISARLHSVLHSFLLRTDLCFEHWHGSRFGGLCIEHHERCRYDRETGTKRTCRQVGDPSVSYLCIIR